MRAPLLRWYTYAVAHYTSHNSHSPLPVIAGLALVVCLGVIVWRSVEAVRGQAVQAKNPAAVLSTRAFDSSAVWQRNLFDVSTNKPVSPPPDDVDGISNIAGNVVGTLAASYVALREEGAYTPEKGKEVAQRVADTLEAKVSHTTYVNKDFVTDPNISYERMLAYRGDMRTALAPLLKNPGYELKLYTNYLASKDAAYAQQLRATISNYRLAVSNLSTVVVPKDEVSYHAALATALSAFAETLNAMLRYVDDPFASAALLSSYQTAETAMTNAFDSLAAYERAKAP